MANLLGQNIGTNYKGILSLDSTINTPLDATLRAVTDGEGNASPLLLSTTSVNNTGAGGVVENDACTIAFLESIGAGPAPTFLTWGTATLKNWGESTTQTWG